MLQHSIAIIKFATNWKSVKVIVAT